MSDWTARQVKEFLERILEERNARYEQRFTDSETATRAALAAAEKAVSKAETASERRFEGVNEFRATLSDQAATFITRTEAGAAIDRNASDLKELTDRFNTTVGHSTGVAAGYGYLIAAVIAATGVVSAVVLIATHH